MNDKRWYTADALTADLRNYHHHLRAASEEAAERRMREHYPEAVAVVVRQEESWRQILSDSKSSGGGVSHWSRPSSITQEHNADTVRERTQHAHPDHQLRS
jgi:hypothetical protein